MWAQRDVGRIRVEDVAYLSAEGERWVTEDVVNLGIADVDVEFGYGGMSNICFIYTHSQAAKEWWAENVEPGDLEALFGADAEGVRHMVEHGRYVANIVEAMVDSGLVVRRVA